MFTIVLISDVTVFTTRMTIIELMTIMNHLCVINFARRLQLETFQI